MVSLETKWGAFDFRPTEFEAMVGRSGKWGCDVRQSETELELGEMSVLVRRPEAMRLDEVSEVELHQQKRKENKWDLREIPIIMKISSGRYLLGVYCVPGFYIYSLSLQGNSEKWSPFPHRARGGMVQWSPRKERTRDGNTYGVLTAPSTKLGTEKTTGGCFSHGTWCIYWLQLQFLRNGWNQFSRPLRRFRVRRDTKEPVLKEPEGAVAVRRAEQFSSPCSHGPVTIIWIPRRTSMGWPRFYLKTKSLLPNYISWSALGKWGMMCLI